MRLRAPTSFVHAPRLLRAPLRPYSSHLSQRLARFASQTVSAEPPKQGLWARSKQLAREHGRIYTAVYLGLSVVDFSIIFAIVLAGGGEYVRACEDWVLSHLDWRRAGEDNGKIKEKVGDWAQRHRSTQRGEVGLETPSEHSVKGEWGSSLWTSAALAYGIHKVALLPFRLGMTIWITPWVVRTLKARGWQIGSTAAAARAAAKQAARS